VGRRLTTVVDTLGLDAARRLGYLAQARAAALPAVLVILDTDAALCRARNTERDRTVPAPVLARQLRLAAALPEQAAAEGWDVVHRVVSGDPPAEAPRPAPTPATPSRPAGLRVVLQVSRFPWGTAPAAWLADLARAAEEAGLDGLALMDHLIQIPQVDRAWSPIPEPWVTLGLLAGTTRRLQLGTLVSPVTFRAPGVLAKAVATLDALTDGRAFCGLGAGWWDREHAAFGLPFPSARARLDQLQVCIETLRALWAPGSKAYHGRYVTLPETTCYPRPVHPIPILVGGSGERRTLRIVAEQADAANLPSDLDRLPGRIAALRQHCADVGRDPAEIEITVLDVPIVGSDREDVARRVERLRGRTAAATYADRHHAGTAANHRRRYEQLAAAGVGTVFLALPDLAGAEDLSRVAALAAR